jgi:hypothetical protein
VILRDSLADPLEARRKQRERVRHRFEIRCLFGLGKVHPAYGVDEVVLTEEQHRFLGGEVTEIGPRRNACALGDLIRGGVVVAVGAEQIQGRFQ